jgi:Derlin-2/3
MAAMLGGGDGALGGLPIEQWWFEMPACTRWWTTATVVTGVLVQCHILTPFQLFYSFRAVFHKQQVCTHQFKDTDSYTNWVMF